MNGRTGDEMFISRFSFSKSKGRHDKQAVKARQLILEQEHIMAIRWDKLSRFGGV